MSGSGGLASKVRYSCIGLKEHAEFLWLLILALLFRLCAVLLFSQGGYLYDGHPVYDYQFYRRIGELSLQGYYPSIDYWIEYPPIFSWTVVGIYRLSLLLPAMRDPIFWFHNLLGSFLAVVDGFNLALIYLIELRLAGRAAALRAATMYALLFWPVYVMLGWLDPLPLLFMLATVYGLVTNRPVLVGLAAGMGFMTKLIPAVVAPIALRTFQKRKEQVACVVAGLITVCLVAAPFLLASPRLFVAGFQSAVARSSWETIWALFEGYFDVGIVAPLETHFDATSAAWQSHPSTLPWTAITGAFVVLYLIALTRMSGRSPRSTVAFAGLAITLLLMFSKGYSSQFIEYVLPFVILIMPNGWGAVFAVLLTLANLLQFPIYPMVFRNQPWVLWVAVVWRTSLWIALCVVYAVAFTDRTPVWLAKLRNRMAVPVTVAAGVAVLGLAWPLLSTYVENRGEYSDLQRYLQPLATADQGIVLSTDELIGYVYPFVRESAIWGLPDDWQQKQEQTAAALQQFSTSHSNVWLLLDYSRGEDARHGFLERALEGQAVKSTNRWLDTLRLVGYVGHVGAGATAQAEWKSSGKTLGQTLKLEDFALPSTVESGNPFRAMLRWRALGPADADYSLFLHVVSPSGAIAAQRDKALTRSGVGTGGWQKGEEIVDANDVLIPTGTPPGEYEVLAGIYRPDTGVRLSLDDGRDSISLGRISVLRATSQRLPRLKGAPVDLDGRLRILGYELESKARKGEELRVALYLQALGEVSQDYRVSIALLRDGAVTVESRDLPGGREYPPSRWRSGEIIRDLRRMTAGDAGRYSVAARIEYPSAPVGSGKDRGTSSGWIVLPGEVVVDK